MYELGVFINNKRLALAGKAKQSKLRIIDVIDSVLGLHKQMVQSDRPVMEGINGLTAT
jgi:hypothetical protein